LSTNSKYNETNYYFDSFTDKEFILDSSVLGYNINDFHGNTTIYYSIKIKNIELTPEQNYNLRVISPGINLPKIFPVTLLKN
jgi:hypothetical protein